MLSVSHKMTFHKNEAAYLYLTMRETFKWHSGYNMACKVLTQISRCKKQVFLVPTLSIVISKMRLSPCQVFTRIFTLASCPSQWSKWNMRLKWFIKVMMYISRHIAILNAPIIEELWGILKVSRYAIVIGYNKSTYYSHGNRFLHIT